MNAPTENLATLVREGQPLVPGQRLGDFLVTRVVGQGGFGIVYEAEDLTLQRRVAIKEYMPSQLASRVDGTVSPVSGRYTKTFELGRRSFLAEARLLAQFHHPGLLEVLHFWEQNGTAYMVMPFYEGRTLDQVLANGPDVIGESWLKAVIRPVLDALEHMHTEDCYHRDVSADNILIRNDGNALLLDLGAARRVIGESDRALTVMLKPGYAPIEQYGDDPECRQGPWTDIYALAAVLYFAVTNRMPPASASRVMHDSLPPLAALAPPGYSARFLEAIDRGLSIRPAQRPRTIGEFRSLLFAATPDENIRSAETRSTRASRSKGAAKTTDAAAKPDASAASARPSMSKATWAFAAAGVVLSLAALAWALAGRSPAVPDAAATLAPSASPASPASLSSLSSPGSASSVGPADTEAATSAADPAPAEQPHDAAPAAFAESSALSAAAEPAIAEGMAQPARPAPTADESAAAGTVRAAPPSAAPGSPSSADAKAAAAGAGTGTVRLAISPWGEVYVDGVSRGVTPPLKQLALDAGRHRIEIRNPAGPTWTKQVDVVAGRRLTLSHRFP
ncbi:MAG: protein kinase [Burkholderiaceae bacterium]|nr:protein kinase [Burkholderiaceae bacterium]